MTKRHRTTRNAPRGTTQATLQKNRKGFGFLVFDNQEFPDAYIPESVASSFFDLDRVQVQFDGSGKIRDLKLVAHRYYKLLGKMGYSTDRKPRPVLVVDRKRLKVEIPLIQTGKPAPLPQPDHWILTQLHYHDGKQLRVEAEIIENFGESWPASQDIGVIAGEYGLQEFHSTQAVQEAERVASEDPLSQLKQRKDLRALNFMTIDGETARDFDDAVFVEKKQDNFVLWVAIADVSHYVKPGTLLDSEAYQRATSVYFPERAFHMLPAALSENVCSLRPNVPRLALVARMEFDKKGRRTRTEMIDGVIQSKRRATYNEIKDETARYPDLFELYQVLRTQRVERGSIDFDLPETEIVVDDKGEPVKIERRERLDSHRLIEEFMIAANEAVTEWALERDSPFLFRIHEEPSGEALKRFSQIAGSFGIRLKLSNEAPPPKEIANIVKILESHPSSAVLNSALLRAMKKAVYSPDHVIHYGLASRAYTHFTSPIRRYPDLIVHRILRDLMHKKGKPKQDKLTAQAAHCSLRERIAQEADWESQRIKKVRWLLKHLGEEFEGQIVSLTERGFFVQIQDPWVDGFVSGDSIGDDQYEYNEERLVFSGRRKRRTFKIGDRVQIQVARADLERREVDFQLLGSVEKTAVRSPIQPRTGMSSRQAEIRRAAAQGPSQSRPRPSQGNRPPKHQHKSHKRNKSR